MSTETRERSVLASAADELFHTVCCDDDEGGFTFCGLDATDMAWAEPHQPSCVVCDDMAAQTDGHWCPRYGTCCGGKE